MKKYIVILLLLCLFLVGCSSEPKNIEKINEEDSSVVKSAKMIKNSFLAHKDGDTFFINMVKVSEDSSENTMIRKNGKEAYVESESSTIILYDKGVNILYDTSSLQMVNLKEVNPEHEDKEIINPFILQYVENLNWVIENEDAFVFTEQESIQDNHKYKIYSFEGKNNDWIKERYEESYSLFEFWKDFEMTFRFDYVFNEKGELIQYYWEIKDANNTTEKTMIVEGKLGREVEVAYSHTGYNFDGILD